jgi:hypothetical protein
VALRILVVRVLLAEVSGAKVVEVLGATLHMFMCLAEVLGAEVARCVCPGYFGCCRRRSVYFNVTCHGRVKVRSWYHCSACSILEIHTYNI